MKNHLRYKYILIILIVISVISVCLAVGIGSVSVSSATTLRVVFNQIPFLKGLSSGDYTKLEYNIVWTLRFPRVRGRINITQLLLAGVALSMIMDAVTKALSLSAKNALAVHNLDFWMTGSLAGAKWGYLGLPLAVMIICLVYLMIRYRTLNVLLLGDDAAVTLGVNVPLMQKSLVLVASLLAGVTISVSGSIGFVGLMVPHICRILVGSDHKKVLPLCVLLGGMLVVWTDVAARLVLAPEELPVGVLTAIVGGPCFIALLRSKSGRQFQ